MWKNLFSLFICFYLIGCTSIPEGVQPISNFDVNKYQGKWYEIARLDHSFERGLEEITAQYKIKDNGDVEVLNKGFSVEKNKWLSATGTAKFVGEPGLAHLKVSFFGPFYGSYIVFELDEHYQYAFVAGPDHSYLWLLSRSKTLPSNVIDKFVARSTELGFDTSKLIYVKH